MRYVYIDEAGTAATEPITIVAAVVVPADEPYAAVENELRECLNTVPARHRSGFVSHARSVWGDHRFRDDWDKDERLAFLLRMMGIPRKMGLAIAFGKVRRDAPGGPLGKFTKAQMDHLMAFSFCLAMADRYVRTYCRPGEVATLIAEDLPECKPLLHTAVPYLRERPLLLGPEFMRPTRAQAEAGIQPPVFEEKATCIRDGVHFARKTDAPFLQIADACAFGLRRYLCGQSHGEEMIQAMSARPWVLEDWAGPSSAGTIHWHLPR